MLTGRSQTAAPQGGALLHAFVAAAGAPAQMQVVGGNDHKIKVVVMLRRQTDHVVEIHIGFAAKQEPDVFALRQRQNGAQPRGVFLFPHTGAAGDGLVPVMVRHADGVEMILLGIL